MYNCQSLARNTAASLGQTSDSPMSHSPRRPLHTISDSFVTILSVELYNVFIDESRQINLESFITWFISWNCILANFRKYDTPQPAHGECSSRRIPLHRANHNAMCSRLMMRVSSPISFLMKRKQTHLVNNIH